MFMSEFCRKFLGIGFSAKISRVDLKLRFIQQFILEKEEEILLLSRETFSYYC